MLCSNTPSSDFHNKPLIKNIAANTNLIILLRKKRFDPIHSIIFNCIQIESILFYVIFSPLSGKNGEERYHSTADFAKIIMSIASSHTFLD